MIGDVKQRLCKELGRKFHEIKLVYNATVEPDVLEKALPGQSSKMGLAERGLQFEGLPFSRSLLGVGRP